MGGGDMKHEGCLPYNCHDDHPHCRHHKYYRFHPYYDLPHDHHVHCAPGQFFGKNDVAVDFVAGHPHGGHHILMRRSKRHHHLMGLHSKSLRVGKMCHRGDHDMIMHRSKRHHHLIGLHSKSLRAAAGKMHHLQHHHDIHDHKLGRSSRFWHLINRQYHGGHRRHGQYYDLHSRREYCGHGPSSRSKSVLLASSPRPAADLITENCQADDDADHTDHDMIPNSTTASEHIQKAELAILVSDVDIAAVPINIMATD